MVYIFREKVFQRCVKNHWKIFDSFCYGAKNLQFLKRLNLICFSSNSDKKANPVKIKMI